MAAARSRGSERELAGLGLLLVLGLAVVVRLTPMLAHPETRGGGFGIFGDSPLYVALGVNLADGQGFAVAARPATPLYPSLLTLSAIGLYVTASRVRKSSWM